MTQLNFNPKAPEPIPDEDLEPVPFTVLDEGFPDGRPYIAYPVDGEMLLLAQGRVSRAAARGAGDQMEVLWRVIGQIIDEESLDDIVDRMEQREFTLDSFLTDTVMKLIEHFAKRPTKPSTASRRSQPNGGRSSTGRVSRSTSTSDTSPRAVSATTSTSGQPSASSTRKTVPRNSSAGR